MVVKFDDFNVTYDYYRGKFMFNRTNNNVGGISFFTRNFSTVFIKTMFKSVQGWTCPLPSNCEQFIEMGIDGSNLEGSILQSVTSQPRGVIILCHPFLKYGMHYFHNNKLAQRLNDQGFVVVTFNFKGFGNSNVKGPSFFDDVLSITRLINKKFPNLPIHLFGCSFGGFHICHALAKNNSHISSVVLDSVPLTVSSYFKSGLLSIAMSWLSKSSLGQPTSTQSIKHSLPEVKDTPILFLYGDKDPYLLKHEISELKTCAQTAQFIAFKGCSHLEIYKKHQQQYTQNVVDFINRNSNKGRKADD